MTKLFPRKYSASDYIEIWHRILLDSKRKSWALFKNGTCVVLMDPSEDLKAQAIDMMKEWGAVHVGSPAGDFGVVKLSSYPGWVVTCHHKDILTYVAPGEINGSNPQEVAVGLHGRLKRDKDAKNLEIIHIEDNRK